MQKAEYRPDIDGLRAVAVLSVLLFHLGVPGFDGGYVGVDVFFVISGFLITGIIRREVLASGAFDYGRFYTRRVRRLFPALFATLFATTMAAVWLFASDHLQDFGGSLLFALVSLSNVYFWAESGYFDSSAILKPLLHTWSLSIEEQFYLFWPILLVFLSRRVPRLSMVAIIITLMSLASLGLNLMFADGQVGVLSAIWPSVARWFEDGATSIFFLLPFRVFEFGIGALFALWADKPFRQPSLTEGVFLSGLAMILWPVTAYSEALLFPSYYALLPCLGTAFVIHAGRHSRLATWLLENPLMVGTGKISYSLYLVHWPLIVFVSYWLLAPLGLHHMLLVAVLTFGLAILMYRYIEQPFRKPNKAKAWSSPAAFALACMGIGVCLLVPAASMWAGGGWAWRFSGDLMMSEEELKRERDERYDIVNHSFGDGTKVVVFGDSQGKDIYFALAKDPKLSVRIHHSPHVCANYYLTDAHIQIRPKKSIASMSMKRCWRVVTWKRRMCLCMPNFGVWKRTLPFTRRS